MLVHNASELSDAELVERARNAPIPGEHDVVDEVSGDEIEQLGSADGPHVVVSTAASSEILFARWSNATRG